MFIERSRKHLKYRNMQACGSSGQQIRSEKNVVLDVPVRVYAVITFYIRYIFQIFIYVP